MVKGVHGAKKVQNHWVRLNDGKYKDSSTRPKMDKSANDQVYLKKKL